MRANNLPSFFVVGAAKSGTTALWKYFQKHPNVFVTDDINQKELGYYSNQYGITNKEQYSRFFSKALPEQIIGEVCHAYLSSAESAEWIKTDIPQAKIIIILRNPINRAYSLFNWMAMEGYENITSFKKALEYEKGRERQKLAHEFIQNYKYFQSGLYYDQVKRYYDEFGQSNVLVVAYEDFNNDQLTYLNKIYKFLGISQINEVSSERVNKSKAVRFIYLQYSLRMVHRYITNNRMRRILLKLMALNTVGKKPKSISNKLRDKLEDKYQEDVKKLTKLCDYNFLKLWFE